MGKINDELKKKFKNIEDFKEYYNFREETEGIKNQNYKNIQFKKGTFEVICFEGCIFSPIRINMFKFSLADMYSCKFFDCPIQDTDFSNAIIKESKFENIKFDNANFGAAILEQVSFEDCEFNDVEFDKTQLENVIFSNCKFKNITFKDTFFAKVKFINPQLTDSSKDSILISDQNCCHKFSDLFIRDQLWGIGIIDRNSEIDLMLFGERMSDLKSSVNELSHENMF